MKLKTNLLIDILENKAVTNKYSKAFLNIDNVFKLETAQEYQFPQEIKQQFKQIKTKYKSFINGIPLKVIEKYYYQHADDLNKYIYILYNNHEINDLRSIDIYLLLEEFFMLIFNLASYMADMYSLEIKTNTTNKYKRMF